jgi:fatty acid desaturase
VPNKVERDVTGVRIRHRVAHPAVSAIVVLGVFVCAIIGALSLITWAIANLPVWVIALIAIGFISLFVITEVER